MFSQFALTYTRQEFIRQYSSELLCVATLLALPVGQWVIGLKAGAEAVFIAHWIVMAISLTVSMVISFLFVREARRSSTEVILNVALLHLLPELVHNRQVILSEEFQRGVQEGIITDKWDSIKSCLLTGRFKSIDVVMDLVELYTYLKYLKQGELDHDSQRRLEWSLGELITQSEERLSKLDPWLQSSYASEG